MTRPLLYAALALTLGVLLISGYQMVLCVEGRSDCIVERR